MSIGVGYYAFSLFLAGLVCLIAIICKVLFSNVKRQQKLLDEKESNLLHLYQSVESIIEEFNDQVKATTAEIRDYDNRAAVLAALLAAPPPEPGKKEPEQVEKILRAKRADPSRQKPQSAAAVAVRAAKGDAGTSGGVPDNGDSGSVLQRFFDETPAQPQPPLPEMSEKQARSEAILSLAEEGKTDAQIARELGITQNEVMLIIGLTGKRA